METIFPAILSYHHTICEKGHDTEWKLGTITVNNLPAREACTSFLLSGCISRGLQIVVLMMWGGTSFRVVVIPGMWNSFKNPFKIKKRVVFGFWCPAISVCCFHQPASSWYMASGLLFDMWVEFRWCHIPDQVTRREIYKNISWNLSFSYFREDESCSTT